MPDSIDFQTGGSGQYEIYEDGGQELFGGVVDRGLPPLHAEHMDAIMPDLKDLEADYEQALSDLDKRIADTPPGPEQQELKQARDDLKDTWRMISHRPPGGHHDIGTFSDKWDGRISDMRTAITNSYQASVGPSAGEGAAKDAPIMAAPMDPPLESHVIADSAKSSSSSGGANASDGASSSEGKGMADVDIDDMVNKMSTDPQAAMDELSDMNPKDRGAVLQAITTQLQQINQMFSMMSNIMKSAHDTAKAAINNMRV